MKLSEISTEAPKSLDKKKIKDVLSGLTKEIEEHQKVLYAQSKYSLLVILQGLDASGKDGLIGSVFEGVNPLGCMVKAFKVPTPEELSYDFLWRVHKQIPPKGYIGIFNRSHYEDVLVPRVENQVSMKTIQKRYKHINHFEHLLEDSGTKILKFYLHVSKKEQHKRLIERQTNPTKFWKHSDLDWDVAKKFDKYLEAYEDIFHYCEKPEWTIVPSDHNWYKEYVVATKIVETLREMKLVYPPLKTSEI